MKGEVCVVCWREDTHWNPILEEYGIKICLDCYVTFDEAMGEKDEQGR